MRLGTWNMEGKGSAAHGALIQDQDCDILLLTEMKQGWSPAGYYVSVSQPMSPRKVWAAVASRGPVTSLSSPHPASAAARVGRTTYVSSILPWRSAVGEPWRGVDHSARTAHAVDELAGLLRGQQDLVWGGDWNHALAGREYAGSKGGRDAVLTLVDELGLVVPTADQPHRIAGLLSIDHIAVKAAPTSVMRVDAAGLSDHDFYVVETRDNEWTRA